ncbi:peptidoglycan-associated lipoprotein Pal [Agitococcus lubricus]|nr:peptidoglycan-associated lipoprotein Pal [Agitococcus lubricus]
MSTTKISLALALVLGLGMTGCASLKGKNTTTTPTTETTSASNTDSNNANATASTNSISEQDRLNANGLGGNNSANNDANANDGTNSSGTDDSTANEVSMADLLTIRLVHFDYDSVDLSQEDMRTLQAHAQYLKQTPNAKVLLAGHADERGTREYNMALGERRANAVQAFLSSNGARASQLDTVSYGKEKPINDGHDEAAWAENRRVEISYTANAPK